jgi:hypothetical protein
LTPALQYLGLGYGDWMRFDGFLVDAVLENTLEPQSWQQNGPLPTHVDGLKQTQITTAIVRSAETGKVVEIR